MIFKDLLIKKNNELNELKKRLLLKGEDKKKLIKKIRYIVDDIELILFEKNRMENRRREFTIEELSKYDGMDGKLGYIAVNGTVYDVTGVNGFDNGSHFGVKLGTDVTDVFLSCHNGDKNILKKLRIVGVLIE